MNDSRARPVAVCYALATIIVLCWVAWFSHRSLIASESNPVYVNFEQAFPVVDGLIVIFLLLSARALRRGSSSVVLFLLLGAGAGFYLGGMGVLCDIEHGIWSRGSKGGWSSWRSTSSRSPLPPSFRGGYGLIVVNSTMWRARVVALASSLEG